MNKISVTIGIPAHNEEKNIANILADLLIQETNLAKIEKIIVACDGCTDDTAKIVKNLSKKNRKIVCIDDGKRLNQTGRLEQMYKLSKSEVFITFDADTRLADRGVVEALTSPFKNKTISLVSGNDTPKPARNFFEQIVVSSINLWTSVRNSCISYDSVHYVHGCVTAVRTKMVKRIKYPKNPSGNDAYLYFYIKNLGGVSTFARKAIVYYRAVGTIKDYFVQNSRFINAPELINKEFGKDMYTNEKLPIQTKVIATIKYLISDPFYGSLSIVMQVLLRLLKPYFTKNKGSWTTVNSTKI